MTIFRRLRRGLLAVVVTSSAVAALLALPVPNAHAFFVQFHERIVRDALPDGEVDETAILQILVGPPPGAGAVGSDAFVTDDFRHIDNAATPADICRLTQEAWNFFIPIVLNGSQPGPGGTALADGPAARAAFGGLAHALEDFYSHSDWVEDNIAVGQLERLAPELMPTCDPAALPAGLHTGYFSLDFGDHEDPLSGCPPGGPPPGFAECHSTLNKDAPWTPRGAVQVPGTTMNQFDLAALLATRDTTELYQQVRGLVASTNGQGAATCLFQADLTQCGGSGAPVAG